MGSYRLTVTIHDDELERFIEAASDPNLAADIAAGERNDDAIELAAVAPYIASCLKGAMGDDTRSG